jgi:general secretion pathway protein E
VALEQSTTLGASERGASLADERQALEAELGEILIRRGRLDARSLDRALKARSGTRQGLLQVLSKLGLVSERDLADAVAEQLGLSVVGPRDYPALPVLEEQIGARFLRESRILPLAVDGEDVVLAMADPYDRYAIDAVRLITGAKVHPKVAVPGELDAAVERLYSRERAGGLVEPVGAGDDESVEYDVEHLKDLASEAPVIRLVNNLIAKAIESRASDIHIEPFEDRVRVRYRIDGVLCEVEPPPARFRAAIVSRIKILARLNIAERRLPQDGRMKIAVRGTPIDLRIATVPTMHGESVVMRLLDRESVRLDFKALGLTGRNLEVYLEALERPHGVLLMTGPTGSGKTTTLYASLVRLNTPERKILTVEDPVEYQLDGINQIQVKQSIDLTFANVLRSLLRHDPDIIMVGEIRDVETAEIAVQAALTGHLVLSTLHTNNAVSSIGRLLDMGVQDYLLTSTLNGVAAQRLVRTLCPHCREPYPAMPELVKQLGLGRYTDAGEVTLWRPRGCAECGGSGYYGRTTILETLVVTDTIRRLILRHAESNEMLRAAVEEGMRTMYDDGMTKALAGETTFEEVLKVTRDV